MPAQQPHNPPPFPGPISNIPVVGPVFDLAGHLLGTFDAKGKFTKAVGHFEGNLAQKAVSDIFHGLDLQTTFIRIAEVLLGIMLIGVGVAKLTGTDNIIMKAATTAGKAAIL
jgi:hypothetical protein